MTAYGLDVPPEATEPMPFQADLWGTDGVLVGHVFARSAASIRKLLEERPDVERARVVGPDMDTRVWRDAETRAWRWR